MLSLCLPKDRQIEILCFGAHCDDVEIGCLGTLFTLIRKNEVKRIHWIIACSDETRSAETKAAVKEINDNLGTEIIKVDFGSFPDTLLPYCAADVKDFLRRQVKDHSPDLVFTHYKDDAHQDHRTISELTYNIFRSHLVLEYEIPKYDVDTGTPNLFCEISQENADRKIDILVRNYNSQLEKFWFTRDLLKASLVLRGVHARAEEGLAEAFYCRKMKI